VTLTGILVRTFSSLIAVTLSLGLFSGDSQY